MIIDFHTHTFPDSIAANAIEKLSHSANIINYTKGTYADLSQSMKETGINYSVILPVATKAGQEKSINHSALNINENFEQTGILSFGTIHPEDDDYKNILRFLSDNGIKGIKLHPVFQKTYFDDIRYKRIIDYAMERNLIVVTHAGFDISFPKADFVTPSHIIPILKELKPSKLVLAHMGGWDCWDEVLDEIAGYPVYFDTSFSLNPLRAQNKKEETNRPVLHTEQFLKIIKKHGADKILFGSDSPWSCQKESVELLKNTGLKEDEQDQILGQNAKILLQL